MARSGSWPGVLRVTVSLLVLWAAVTLAVPWFAADLPLEVGGFPLGYWLAAQGALLAYLGIVTAYAWWVERLEAQVEGRRDGSAPPGQPKEERGAHD